MLPRDHGDWRTPLHPQRCIPCPDVCSLPMAVTSEQTMVVTRVCHAGHSATELFGALLHSLHACSLSPPPPCDPNICISGCLRSLREHFLSEATPEPISRGCAQLCARTAYCLPCIRSMRIIITHYNYPGVNLQQQCPLLIERCHAVPHNGWAHAAGFMH